MKWRFHLSPWGIQAEGFVVRWVKKTNHEDRGSIGKELAIMSCRAGIGGLVGKIREVMRCRGTNGAGGLGSLAGESGVAPARRASRRSPYGALILPKPVWARVRHGWAEGFTNPAITIMNRMRGLTEPCRNLDSTLTNQGWSRLVKVSQGSGGARGG